MKNKLLVFDTKAHLSLWEEKDVYPTKKIKKEKEIKINIIYRILNKYIYFLSILNNSLFLKISSKVLIELVSKSQRVLSKSKKRCLYFFIFTGFVFLIHEMSKFILTSI